MLRFLRLVFTICALIGTHYSHGQETNALDSTKVVGRDSAQAAEIKRKLEYTSKRFNPRKALLFSAILPGMGQVYNKRYWKVPLVYGAIILAALPIDFYNNKYLIYKNQLFAVINYPDPDPAKAGVVTPYNLLSTSPPQLAARNFTKQQLEDLANTNRRQRDYITIIAGIVYLIQLVDAHVDAHLKEFKVNPKLQVKIEPRFEQNYFAGNTSGMALVFKF